tara:strand:- start:2250 stop:2531 length:282 start_codon:yes stop_codon:yes gene_type:complete
MNGLMKLRLGKWTLNWEQPDERTMMIHKETSFSILSGLITQAPLVFFSNWFMLDVMQVQSSFTITSVNIILLTIVGYIRVFYTRKYFSNRYDN